ncbi:MAG: hypothetical protein ACP5NZ_02905 [Nanobdellota archaeon]
MISQKRTKEDPLLYIYWAEAILPHPQDKILNLEESRNIEFIYQYLKDELNGFDNSKYKEDFLNLMKDKYNFSQEDLEKRLENIKKEGRRRNN